MTSGAASPTLDDTAGTPGGAARRRLNMERWQKRSRQIHFYRRALPAAIAAILVLLTGWVLLRGVLTRIGDLRGAIGTIHMSNAHFYGRDGVGRPYVMGAAIAVRNDNDLQRIALTKPVLTFDSSGAQTSHISADQGVYREDDQILRLRDHVVMHDQSGDTFLTDRAIVDTVHSWVVGRSHVQGFGPTGAVTADSYAVYDKGQRVVFQGNVHSRLKHR
jgi:lipopolysaccharide export system protein LptC